MNEGRYLGGTGGREALFRNSQGNLLFYFIRRDVKFEKVPSLPPRIPIRRTWGKSKVGRVVVFHFIRM